MCGASWGPNPLEEAVKALCVGLWLLFLVAARLCFFCVGLLRFGPFPPGFVPPLSCPQILIAALRVLGPTRANEVLNIEAGNLRDSATRRNTSSNHLTLQKAGGPSFSSKQSSHQTKANKRSYLPPGSSSNGIYKTACSDGTQFWVRKTFSKPASLKRAFLFCHRDSDGRYSIY